MRRKRQTRITVIVFGIFMAVVMVVSLFTGYILQISQQMAARRQQAQALEPTPVPTFEPPISTELITLGNPVLQGNGVFSIAKPEPPDWGSVESSFDSFTNRALLRLRDDRNVIEASLQDVEQPVSTVDELSALLSSQQLGPTWREYSSWAETQRTTITENGQDYLQLDFELEFRNRTFVARQLSWIDGDNVKSVRVITPSNATDLLVFLLNSVKDTFEINEQFGSTPISWDMYYDAVLQHAIRYPNTWALTDSAEGLPASIETNGVALRVESVEGSSVADEDAATAYAEGLPQVTEITDVVEVERGGVSGYSVAYETRNIDGETGSGVVVLLNGEDMLHVANLRVDGIEANLNEEGDDLAANQYVTVMQTFAPLADIELAADQLGTAGTPITEDTGQAPQNFGGF